MASDGIDPWKLRVTPRPVALVLVLLIVLSFSLQSKVLRRSMGWLWRLIRRMLRAV